MLITTQDSFAEHEIVETRGVVQGNTIRAWHGGPDAVAGGLRTSVGGEIIDYTKMLATSREQAVDRMLRAAKRMKADGVVGVTFATTNIALGANEVLVYGTAVKLREVPAPDQKGRSQDARKKS